MGTDPKISRLYREQRYLERTVLEVEARLKKMRAEEEVIARQLQRWRLAETAARRRLKSQKEGRPGTGGRGRIFCFLKIANEGGCREKKVVV